MNPSRLLESVFADLRYAVRSLRRSPVFASAAIVTLALGIGANVAVFAVVNGLLLRPLPYPEPDRLVAVAETLPSEPGAPIAVSYPNFVDWQQRQHVFTTLALYREATMVLTGAGEPEQAQGALATAGLWRGLGIPPAIGRTFTADEDRVGAAPVVVIGHKLWQRRFANRAAIGQSLVVDDIPRTVIGVMPAGFDFPDATDLWIPAAVDTAAYPRGRHSFECFARLRSGVTGTRAGSEMAAIARQLSREYPADNEGLGTVLQPLRGSLMPARASVGFSLLMGAVAFVLLIACANLANLMLGRAAARGHELAIRVALGATRPRLLRQLLTESGLLALLGAGLGLLTGALGRDALLALVPVDLPGWLRFDIDATVAAFALLLAVLAIVVFGLVPALRASRPDVTVRAPRTSSGSRDRLRAALIVSEVALAVVLLAGGGLMMRALATVLATDPGIHAANVWSGRLSLPPATYPGADEQRALFGQVLEQIRSLPGVRRASAISSLPMSGSLTERGVTIEGRPPRAANEELLATICSTLPDYFETLGINVLRGRTFTPRDDRQGSAPTAVVNEAFVKRYLPSGDPIGRRVTLGSGDAEDPWMTIVGVVADVRHKRLDVAAEPALFMPYDQRPSPSMTIVVKADAAPAALTAPIRRIVSGIDRDRPLFAIRSMDEVIARSVWPSRFFTWLLGVFGATALFLACVGVYGVISYSVAQRTSEIGVRLALGAQRRDIHRLVMRDGLVLTFAGLATGLVGAAMTGRVLGSWLHDVSPTDPATYAGVSLAIVFAAAAACFLPSRRAARLDPMATLRQQ